MPEKYHSYRNHIKPMLMRIKDDIHLNGIDGESKKRILYLAAIFHDIYNVAGNIKNEENSAEYFLHCYHNKQFILPALFFESSFKDNLSINHQFIVNAYEDGFIPFNIIENVTEEEKDKIIELIMNTKDTFNKRHGDELGHYFYLLDTYILREGFYDLIQYEHGIYNEYKNKYTLAEYKKGRIEFLQKCLEEIQTVNEYGIKQLIKYVEERDYGSVGIFAGSFNPFHIGHKNVLEQAKRDFDKVIVIQMQDFNKPVNEYRMPKLKDCLVITSNETLVNVFETYKQGHRSASIVRALRNGDDLQHEQNLKLVVHDFNKHVRFTYYLADEGFSHISSSLVRSLPDDLRGKYLV
jgi:cytidyltransferase-like protein